MANGLNIKIEGTAEIDAALRQLMKVGEKKSDINKVFKIAMQPLVEAGKSQAPRGIYKSTGRQRLSSREHKSGTLIRSIRFKTSKKFKGVYYVVAGRNRAKSANAWYAHFVGAGTRRGIRSNPFMDRAWSQTGSQVLKDVENGLIELYNKAWTK